MESIKNNELIKLLLEQIDLDKIVELINKRLVKSCGKEKDKSVKFVVTKGLMLKLMGAQAAVHPLLGNRVFLSRKSVVDFFNQNQESKDILTHSIIHELLHLYSKGMIFMRWNGKPGGKPLDEAITETLAYEIFKEYQGRSSLKRRERFSLYGIYMIIFQNIIRQIAKETGIVAETVRHGFYQSYFANPENFNKETKDLIIKHFGLRFLTELQKMMTDKECVAFVDMYMDKMDWDIEIFDL